MRILSSVYVQTHRPRFHCNENLGLVYRDLKSPLDDMKHSEMSCQALALFVSISNLFLTELILIQAIILLELYFCILNNESMKFSNLCDSSCVPL